ncbi:site-specific integrase [Cronbergia sp. UHCC 0137]|uniref:site-specific integrase n=1 Tax=Cronbergia sp. UHCC 0137 TaxID=3110239 RepID=UPI002B1F0A88|nr:site-specific integrase [Cronbergia sp. UHCC 0137]MEA5620881.1 site-specific integrase [Cronbergia sp. UHCC 0137]
MKATRQHLQQKFDKGFVDAKARLKAGKTKVGLVLSGSGDTIQLQASLPLKPGDVDTNGKGVKQYKISLNIPANLDGLLTAEEEAHELGKLIARKQFEWTDKYLGKINKNDLPKTVGEILKDFETEYFKTHKLTEKSKHTFFYYQEYLKRYIGSDTLLSQDAINQRLSVLGDHAKHSTIKTLKVLKSTLKLECFSFEGIKNKRPEVQVRDIPTDDDVVKCYQFFHNYSLARRATIKKKCVDSWKLWEWVYGMLATYGLRPRELFVNPAIDWWLSDANKDNTWKVDKETKTGHREALPLHPEWVELFDLKNADRLIMLKSQTEGRTSFSDINIIRVNCSSWFRRVQVPFTPYDLRHAWAIRAHIMGVPIKAAADNLGHSVEIHTEIYQKWFSLDNRKKVIKQAVERRDDDETLKDENARLKAENEYLRQALTRKQVSEVLSG